jgi:hypothetical protein
MRILLAIVVAAGLGWSGWWFWNASMREAAVEAWLAERRDAGWVAEAEVVNVQGFPNRLDMIVTGLALADPVAEWSWTAPEFQVLSLTWKPHHVISVWPGEQVFATPYETVRIASEMLRGSVVFEPRPGLALDRTAIEIEEMRLVGDAGWEAVLGSAVLATRQSEPGTAPEHSHDVSFVAENLSLPEGWTAGLERAGVLPARMEAAELDATLAFDGPWDQRAIESDNPRLEQVAIRDLRVSWGQLDLRGRGTLRTDAEGYAEGEIDLRVRNWREMLEIAVNAGMIGSAAARGVETGLGLLARLTSDRNSIQVPLVFEGGRARIGPVPVGGAPRLAGRLRR